MGWRLVLSILFLIVRTNSSTNISSRTISSMPRTAAHSSSANIASFESRYSNSSFSSQSTMTKTSVVGAIFRLVFRLNETIHAAVAKTTSSEFSGNDKSICYLLDAIYRQIFTNFLLVAVNDFRNGLTVTNSSLEIKANGIIPNTSSSSSNILPDSINVTQVPQTFSENASLTNTSLTQSTETKIFFTNTSTVAVIFNLVFSINETFTAALLNTSSPQFSEKAADICNQLEAIYRQNFTNVFRMVIHDFRNGSIKVNSSLEFNANGSIPTNATLLKTLSNVAMTNSSLNIILNSINITQVTVTNTSSTPNTSTNISTHITSTNSSSTNDFSTKGTPTKGTPTNGSSTNSSSTISLTNGSSTNNSTQTTSTNRTSTNSLTNGSSTNMSSINGLTNDSSTNNSLTSGSSTNSVTNGSSANGSSTNGSLPNSLTNSSSSLTTFTNNTNGSSGNTPSNSSIVSIFNLIFRINETFYASLANNSSAQFAAKATNICSQVEPLYREAFKSFTHMIILTFSNGSIVTNSYLYINSSGLKVTVTKVKKTLLNGLSNLTFPVIPNSIRVTQTLGNSMPPLIPSSLSMTWMSLLSFLLPWALHF